MRFEYARAAAIGLLCWLTIYGRGAVAQDDGIEGSAEAAGASAGEEVVVIGRTPRELRSLIERSEDEVFARFNEINSDDRFDIVCRWESVPNSRIDRRVCRSLGWREQDAAYSQALLQELRGEAGAVPQQMMAEQRHLQIGLQDEMRRLLAQDEELQAAVQRLGRAYGALKEQMGARVPWSLSQEVAPDDEGLPYGADRMFKVLAGRDQWIHPLTYRTFEIGHVTGEIRQLELDCANGRGRLEYEANAAVTVPPTWGACTLWVDAKRDTTYALFEFE